MILISCFIELVIKTPLKSFQSDRESSYVIIGLSRFGQLLVVAHTDREEKIRIISARKATRQEKRFYEEGS
ncbi:MAG: BrnT family toxin [Nostoc sp. DedQUE12a]|nr:BrnT family toxin [Nostoc sp. DedQUE12a]